MFRAANLRRSFWCVYCEYFGILEKIDGKFAFGEPGFRAGNIWTVCIPDNHSTSCFFVSPPPPPVDTRRDNNVIIMSKRRCFDAIMTLSLRHMPTGLVPISQSGLHLLVPILMLENHGLLKEFASNFILKYCPIFWQLLYQRISYS